MQSIGKGFTGFVTVLLYLAGTLSTYSQTAVEYGTTYFAPMQPITVEDQRDGLAREIEFLKSQLAVKADKPDASKGWTPPKVGALVFMDYVTAMNNNWDGLDTARGVNVDTQNGFGFREARLMTSGTGYGFLDYRFDLGLEKNTNFNASYKDVFLGTQNVPILQYVRIGHQYVEDAGSEICIPAPHYTFMEAPAPAGQHFMSRRLGITSRHLFAEDRLRLFFGVYNATNISDIHYQKDDNQGIVLNTRMTFAPVFCRDGHSLFLYGAYYNYVNSTGSRPLAFNRPGGWDVYNPNSLENFFSNEYQKTGFEIAWQEGRFCVQTDLFLQHYADVISSGANIGNQTNYGGFVMARWFLTNNYRKYNLKSASWDGVDVSHPLRFEKQSGVNWPSGYGAWELATMYGFYNSLASLANADDRMTNHQIGVALNWYWNPQVKWAVNYIHDMTDARYVGKSFHPTGDYLGMSCRIAF
ncbi:MAG: OprO/OprP family phosphate-selective porin [Planctomycetaceae bacterium]|nr:OprO/OprP family phosphate-selective porin [Planctomycetaceae bacterium]